MYEEIGQISYPDARKQTFCYTGSRQTLFFLLMTTCCRLEGVVVVEVTGTAIAMLARTPEYTMVEVVVVVYSPCWSVDRSPLPGE